MGRTGTTRSGGGRRLRPLAAVLALYALVLQAVLGGAAALPVGGPMEVRCLPPAKEDGRGRDLARDPDDGPVHRHAGCCTGAPPAPDAALPAIPVLRPFRPAARSAWTPQEIRAARPSLDRLAKARAPPVV